MCLCMIDKYDSTPYHVMTKKKKEYNSVNFESKFI